MVLNGLIQDGDNLQIKGLNIKVCKIYLNSYSLTNPNVVGTQKNRLIETFFFGHPKYLV